jgi:dTDP-4-amino-4,6-dideoxygalactose transaminase
MFPRASTCEDTTITLPIFPGMSDSDQDRVIEALASALRG